MTSDQVTIYELLGRPWFDELVDRFYDLVEQDPVLAPLHDDLTESRRTLSLFLQQYWGGPPAYSEEKGHPRLRMRHARVAITAVERDAWLAAMTSALAAAELDPTIESVMLDYFSTAADHMINR